MLCDERIWGKSCGYGVLGRLEAERPIERPSDKCHWTAPSLASSLSCDTEVSLGGHTEILYVF